MRKPRLLMVDDGPDDRELARMGVEASGIKVDLTMLCSGEEALDYLRCHGAYAERNQREIPDVVFLDINLGAMTGFDVLHEIRKDAFWRWVPVVILSTSTEESDIRLAYREGANSYLVKGRNEDDFKKHATTILTYWLEHNCVVPLASELEKT